MLSYRYHSLQYNDSVRLLTLHPSLRDSDPIRCTIQHVRLSDAFLGYEAVSYTWGNTTQMRAIYFHDGARELQVGHNCYNALQQLRHKSRDRLLWIDAICINQSNLQERARQVLIMHEIYSLAFNALVVLGESNANNGILFEELAAADEELLRTGYCDREPPSDAMIRLLEDLFRHPWFKRVWVLQEVCAKSSVQFFCGSARFSYHSLRNLYFGYNKRTVVTQAYWPQVLYWIGSPPENFSTTQLELWHRLGESREYLATDPKDRVFALQSLTGPHQSILDPLINYAQSTEECFTEVANFLLPVLGLRLLTAVRHPHDKAMPSWIPDWSQNFPLNVYFMKDLLGEEDRLPAPGRSDSHEQHHAVRSFTGRDHDINLELLVKGCRYARIVDTSQVFQFADNDDAARQMRRLYYSLINLRQIVDAEGMSDDPTMSIHLGETILKAMISMEALQLHRHLCRGYSGFTLGDKNRVDRESIERFSDSLQQCRISIMENSELVISPEAVRPGDTICIFLGSSSPCALRGLPDGKWSLISGDCHIFLKDFEILNKNYEFLCDDYVAGNQDEEEEFILRWGLGPRCAVVQKEVAAMHRDEAAFANCCNVPPELL